MVIVDFEVKEDFEFCLADRFEAFMQGLTEPCVVAIDIESRGGYTAVLERMELIISQKKAEGYVFATNVDAYAHSCGFFLFMLGDIKTCSDTASFMVHSSGFKINQRINSNDAREILLELEQADLLTDRIMAENTNATPEMLAFLKKNENYMSREDLIYLGFIEENYELI